MSTDDTDSFPNTGKYAFAAAALCFDLKTPRRIMSPWFGFTHFHADRPYQPYHPIRHFLFCIYVWLFLDCKKIIQGAMKNWSGKQKIYSVVWGWGIPWKPWRWPVSLLAFLVHSGDHNSPIYIEWLGSWAVTRKYPCVCINPHSKPNVIHYTHFCILEDKFLDALWLLQSVDTKSKK